MDIFYTDKTFRHDSRVNIKTAAAQTQIGTSSKADTGVIVHRPAVNQIAFVNHLGILTEGVLGLENLVL